MKITPSEQRFWRHVEKTETCWVWTGANADGYGLFYKTGGGMQYAHRFSWEHHCGSIPAGLKVLHHCDNHSCIRPDHLFVGTQKDNMQDAVKKGRNVRKLTEAQVLEIRQRLSRKETKKSIASLYGVGRDTITRISTQKSWKHLL